MSRDEEQKQWTVLDLVNWTARFFEKKGIDAPRLNAELLLAHVLGWERIRLYTEFANVPTDQQRARFRELVLRRAARCPLQYLLGKAGFLSREFLVTPAVLIPRQETELLVEEALGALRAEPLEAGATVVDLCTGSGVIAVSLALELPQCSVVASDASAEALPVARQNVERHGVADRVRLMQGDLFEPIRRAGLAGQVAAVVSNPPYVCDDELAHLMPEVRQYEPERALRGGPDGLDYYRRIAAQVGAILRPRGLLALEVGAGQAAAVTNELLASGAVDQPRVRKDFQGIGRVVVCRRR